MITVLLTTGDRAEADDPEAATVAARTMLREALDGGTLYSKPTASFYADGKLVRAGVTLAALTC